MAAIASAFAGARAADAGVIAAAATTKAKSPVAVGARPGDLGPADPTARLRGDELQRAVTAARDGGTVRLEPGLYQFRAIPYADSTCANCERPDSLIRATRGLLVRGRGVRLVGAGPGRTILETRAGYGVLFEHCTDCGLDSLTVTGGIRDTSGMASDAAVVVKGGRVSLNGLDIAENLGDSAIVKRTVVGIMGVTARDGAELTVRGCQMVRNSWDGIALFRGVRAVIEDNWIDGVDQSSGGRHGGGRGVGIGVTWDARALVRGNAVRHYWKGIGVFVDAQVVAEENVIEEILTWGMTLWDADKGRPHGTFRNNVIYRTGACGIAVWRGDSVPPEPGEIVGNALVETGANPRYDTGNVYCSQRALALDRLPVAMRVAENLRFANREAAGRTFAAETDSAGFATKVRGLVHLLGARRALRGTEFMKRFGPGAGR